MLKELSWENEVMTLLVVMNKLENKKLHLISFDVPFPANYGGVIDVFYKINSLHKIGIQVILHCFQYGREK